jgi:uncharacterized protein YcbX
MPSVSWLSIAPVKGLALRHPDEILLERHGVAENRRFYLVGPDGRRFGAKESGRLFEVEAECDAAGDRLTLRFPDGFVVGADVRLGEPLETDFYGRPVRGHVVEGPWAEALSELAGRPLRLVRADGQGAGVDRGDGRGPVTLVSDASIAELGRQSGADGPVDGRRFRMLVGVEGCAPHEEDTWLGLEVRLGGSTVRLTGTVGRCVVTTRNPDSGMRDFDTLGAINAYRGRNPLTGELDMGVYGIVVEPGRVRVGDPVEPLAPRLVTHP